jgi:hypothetical protein
MQKKIVHISSKCCSQLPREAGRAVTVRQILMNVLMLLSVRTTLNVRILMDLTSVCVMMDTSDLEMFVLVSQIFLMDLKIVHKSSQFGP